MKIKDNHILSFLSFCLLLTSFRCIGDGPFNWYEVYNHTSKTINVEVEIIGRGIKRFKVLSQQNDGRGFGGFSIKKKKPSEEAKYVKITKENGTVLFDLRGEALDTHFKKVKETESFILYRLDVN